MRPPIPSDDASGDPYGEDSVWLNADYPRANQVPETPRIQRIKARDFFGRSHAAPDGFARADERAPAVSAEAVRRPSAANESAGSWYATALNAGPVRRVTVQAPGTGWVEADPTGSAFRWPRDEPRDIRPTPAQPSASGQIGMVSAPAGIAAPSTDRTPLGVLFQRQVAAREAAARSPSFQPVELAAQRIHRLGPREIPMFDADPFSQPGGPEAPERSVGLPAATPVAAPGRPPAPVPASTGSVPRHFESLAGKTDSAAAGMGGAAVAPARPALSAHPSSTNTTPPAAETKGKLAPLTFADKFRDVRDNPVQLAPFAGGAAEVYDIARIGLAAYRLSEADRGGIDADPEDIRMVKQFVDEQARDTTFGYKVAAVLAALPAFAGELALTGGAYTAGQKLALKAGRKALEKFGSKAGAEILERVAARAAAKAAGRKVAGTVGASVGEKAVEFGARAASSAVGAAVQTVPSGAFHIAEDTIQRMMPQFQFSENERGKLAAIVTQEGDDFGPALLKSLGNQYAEVLSERTGGALGFIPGADKARLMKAALMKRWFDRNPGVTPGAFARLVQKAGWHGVLGEMFEERVGDATKAALGLQGWGSVIPSGEQLLVEAAAFSVPGAVVNAGHALAGRRKQTAQPPAPSSSAATPPSLRPVAPHPQPAAARHDDPAATVSRPAPASVSLISQPSVVAPGPADASPGATEPATASAEGAPARRRSPIAESRPAAEGTSTGSASSSEDAPSAEAELATRERELTELPANAEPFQRDLLQNRIGALRKQAAQRPAPTAAPANTDTNTDASEHHGPTLSESTSQPNTSNAGTPPSAIKHSTPQRTASEPPAVAPLQPTAQPAASPAPSAAPALARPWGDVNKADVGQTVQDDRGRRGIIYQVGWGGAVAARGADGKAFGIPPGHARIVPSAGVSSSSVMSSETSGSWSGVEHANRNVKPNPARPAKAYSPAQMQELVRRIYSRHRALFEALGVGAPVVDPTLEAALAMADGQLLINPTMLAEESARLTQQGTSTEQWLQAALHEEWLHAAQMEAEARGGRDWEKTYAEIWNDPGLDPKLREGAAQSYLGFEQLSDAQKGAEVMRMVLSARWSGTITERIYRAVQSFVDYLRGLDPAAQQSTLFRETLARAEAVLHEAHRQGSFPIGNRQSGKVAKPKLFAAPIVGMKLRDVGGDFPVDADQPRFLDVSGRSDVIAARAGAWFRNAPGHVKAADGSSIEIWNKERDSFGSRVWHMIRDEGSQQIHLGKARWIPNLLTTLQNAAVRLINPANGYRLYLKRYGNGMRHVVIINPEGRVDSQKAFAGKLITQFPEERNLRIAELIIDWVRE